MSKKKIALYCLAGIALFVVLVIQRTPAGFALAQVAKYSKSITYSQPSGTVWDGEAANIIVYADGKEFALGFTEWELDFLPMLLGKVAVDLEANNAQQKVKGAFVFGVGGSIRGEDVEMVLDASLLGQFSPMPIDVQGMVDVNLTEMAYSDKVVEALDGNIVLRDGMVSMGTPLQLGTYVTKLSVKDNIITGELSDIDGVVEMNGIVTLSPETRKYTADINLKPKETADPFITQSLQNFTRKKPDGSFQFRM